MLRRMVSGFDAAAIAATYGSVSAVTFITTTQYLETHNVVLGDIWRPRSLKSKFSAPRDSAGRAKAA